VIPHNRHAAQEFGPLRDMPQASLLDLPLELLAMIIDELRALDEDDDEHHYLPSETLDSGSDHTWTGSDDGASSSEDEDINAQMEHGEAAFIELTEGFRGAGDDESAYKLEELMGEWPSVLGQQTPSRQYIPWPSFDDIHPLSHVCRRLRRMLEQLGYRNHLKLHYDEYECRASMAIPEVMRSSVRYGPNI
jgi:hypothetical protein